MRLLDDLLAAAGSSLASEGLELANVIPSSYGLVPTTVGCVEEIPMHEGHAVDSLEGAGEMPGMEETSWLNSEQS